MGRLKGQTKEFLEARRAAQAEGRPVPSLSTSSEVPSDQKSPSSQMPQGLPPVKVRKIRPTNNVIALPDKNSIGERRKLPEDPSEQQSILAKYRPMSEIIIGSVDASIRVAGKLSGHAIDPLDKAEKEGGNYAMSALLYQYGADMDAKVLCALWILGISTPRLLQIAAENSEKKKAKVEFPQNFKPQAEEKAA
jgi:hypothetical protein